MSDRQVGTRGTDRLEGGSGEDTLFGLDGADQLYGYDNDDILIGGKGEDSLYGGDGADFLAGGDGVDTLDGGAGRDIVSYNTDDGDKDGNKYLIDLRAGTTHFIRDDGSLALEDRLISIEGVIGSSRADLIYGSDDTDDLLLGGAGADKLYGGDGADILAGGDGLDTLIGGEGRDLVSYDTDEGDKDGNGYQIDLRSGTTHYYRDDGSLVLEDLLISFEGVVSIEGVLGSSRADAIYGRDDTDDILIGGSGADSLFGGDGNDVFSGGSKTNAADTYFWAGTDQIYGGAGSDTVNYLLDEDDADGHSDGGGFDINLTAGITTARNDASYIEDYLSSIENAVGSDRNDKITGTDGGNLLLGSDGLDRLFGQGGNDILSGGAGVDHLNGGEGKDTVNYSVDKDDAYGTSDLHGFDINLTTNLTTRHGDTSAIEDILYSIENALGSNKSDSITGNGGSNVLVGGDGADSIKGGAGADILAGGNGQDYLDGGSGQDYIAYNLDPGDSDTGVDVDLAAGLTYYLNSEFGRVNVEDYLNSIEHVIGSDNADIIAGDAADNVLGGQAGNDILLGRDGNDVLIGDHGYDVLDGGVGIDTARYDIDDGGEYDSVEVDLQAGRSWYLDADLNRLGIEDDLRSIENVTGSYEADKLLGDGVANTLAGEGGDDHIDGRGGDDTLSGGAGRDTLNGGAGFDFVHYAQDARDATGFGAEEGFVIDIDEGYSSRLNNPDQRKDTLIDIEGVVGSQKNDQIVGNDKVNTLIGGDGDDKIEGGGQNDTLSGGEGQDVLHFSLDREAETSGRVPASVDVDLTAGTAAVTLSDGSRENDVFLGIEGIVGTDGNDRITGDDADNSFVGLNGDDIISGGAGNDRISGAGAGSNTLDGGADVDVVSYIGQIGAGVEVNLTTGTVDKAGTGTDQIVNFENAEGTHVDDLLIGDAGSNVLSGQGGADRLDGAAGDDTLIGGDGFDILTGGRGADVLDGGSGLDSASYADSEINGTRVDFDAGTARVSYADSTENDTLDSVEGVIGSDGVDTFVAGATARLLDGGESADLYQLSDDSRWVKLKFEDQDTVELQDLSQSDFGVRLAFVSESGLSPENTDGLISHADTTLGVVFTNEDTGSVLAYSTLDDLGLSGSPDAPPNASQIAQGVADAIGSLRFADGEAVSGGSLSDLIADRVVIADSYTAERGQAINTGDADDYFLLHSGTATRSESNGGTDAYDILGGDHIVYTGADADTIYVKDGAVDIATGDGDDIVYLNGGQSVVDLGLGNDTAVIDTSVRDAQIKLSDWQEGDNNTIRLVGEGADDVISSTDASTGVTTFTLHGQTIATAAFSGPDFTIHTEVETDENSTETEDHFFTPSISDSQEGLSAYGASGFGVTTQSATAGGAGFSVGSTTGLNASAGGVGVLGAVGASIGGSAVSVSGAGVAGASVGGSLISVSGAGATALNVSSALFSTSGAGLAGVSIDASAFSISGAAARGVFTGATGFDIYGARATGVSVWATGFSPNGLPPSVAGVSLGVDATGVALKIGSGDVASLKSFGVSAGSLGAAEVNGVDLQVASVDIGELNGVEIEASTAELGELEGLGLETFVADVLNAAGLDAEAASISVLNANGAEAQVATLEILDFVGAQSEVLTGNVLNAGGAEAELLTLDALDATGLEAEFLTLDALDAGGIEAEAATLDAIDLTLLEAEVGTLDLLDTGLIEAEAGTIDIGDASLIEIEAATIDIGDASLIELEAATIDIGTASLIELEAATLDIASASLVELEVASVCAAQVGVINIGAAGACAGKVCAGANLNVGPDIGPCLGVNIPICPII